MSRFLPSMNALRAFEASARYVSFTLAANELGVSQAAVSRFVRILEEHLGVALFVRLQNGLELTEAGTLLAPGLRSIFERVDHLMRETQVRGRVTKVLTVGIGPTLATRWLIPRLGRFTSAHPDIEIRIATGGAVAPFNEEWTCAIRLGQDPWPGFVARRLFTMDLLLVCAPEMARQLRRPADLANVPLLRVRHAPNDWSRWWAAAALPMEILARITPGPVFDYYGLALQAAADGLGVVLAMRAYVEEDIAIGRLASPFPLTVPKIDAFYLVHRPGKERDPGLQAFTDWLEIEIVEPAAVNSVN
ncbi:MULTISPECIES: LysR substrate-binding domain-containing protein [Bradyrhizobium]|uniref:LysR substrate-binding domain-containing protein n=1 Tax=Bradyrhizobium TaxID=374 RepID=UPI001CE304D1|nr:MULTISPECIES: LysR substrate-binding domain-containing protein [Bradyrhizobium]MCA6104102.1 LysR family transcriptional regulator [Bradyrhizobium australafricanum]MCC8969979.1 LysR family transcriptional regulator [Bradyrhizobium brasilense]